MATPQKYSDLGPEEKKLHNRLGRVAGRHGYRLTGCQQGGWHLTPLNLQRRSAPGRGMSLEELRDVVCGEVPFPGTAAG